MSEVIHAEKQFRDKQVERLVKGLQGLYNQAGDNWSQFRDLATHDLKEAIRRLPEFIRKAREVNGENSAYAYAETLAGGPNQDWIVPLVNLLSECYGELDKESRKAILVHCLNYFEGLRYDYSQNHVELMTSPLLVADIVVNCGLYWPGLDRAKYFLGKGRGGLRI